MDRAEVDKFLASNPVLANSGEARRIARGATDLNSPEATGPMPDVSGGVPIAPTIPVRPVVLPPQPDGIPESLKALPNWICWRLEWNGRKWDKVPYMALGLSRDGKPYGAKTTKRNHWKSFDAAAGAYEASRAWGCDPFDGIGFVFDGVVDADGNCLFGIDFDIADDGVENHLQALNSYTEKSPSERGFHVIARAKPLATGVPSKEVAEIYCAGRYLTFTGVRRVGFPATVETRIDEVDALVAAARAAKGQAKDNRTVEVLPDAYASLGPLPAWMAKYTRSEITVFNDELRAGYCEIDLGEYASMLDAIPDEHLGDDDNWRRLAIIVGNECAKHPELKADMRRIFDERSARAPGYDKEDNAKRIDRFERCEGKRDNPLTYDSLRYIAQKYGWKEPSFPPMGGGTEEVGDVIDLDRDWNYHGGRVEFSERQLLFNYKVIDAAIADCPLMFQSGGDLLWLKYGAPPKFDMDQKPGEPPKWPPLLPGVVRADAMRVQICANRVSWFQTKKKKVGKETSLVDVNLILPRRVCADFLLWGETKAKYLAGISTLPAIAADGAIRVANGYDPSTCVFHAHTPSVVVPDVVTLAMAQAAAERLLEPFGLYEFTCPDLARWGVLALILSAARRPFLGTCPIFAVVATTSGVGKGYLLRSVSELILGMGPVVTTYGHDDAEFAKRIDTAVLAKPAILMLDNMNDIELKGGNLESYVTERVAQVRLFTTQVSVRVENVSLITATGVNLVITGDTARRTIVLEVLGQGRNPELHPFAFNPITRVREQRQALLNDLFTVLRGFRQAGSPEAGKASIGSFETWGREVRDLICWLGGGDVAKFFVMNKDKDPGRLEDGRLMQALLDKFGAGDFTAKDIGDAVDRARALKGALNTKPAADDLEIHDAVEAIWGSRWSTKGLGRWMKKMIGAFRGELKMAEFGQPGHDKVQRCRVFKP